MIKHLTSAKNPKYDEYQGGFISMIYKFFDKNSSVGTIKNENISSKQLAEEVHKPIIRKLDVRIVYSSFIDNVLGGNLSDV